MRTTIAPAAALLLIIGVIPPASAAQATADGAPPGASVGAGAVTSAGMAAQPHLRPTRLAAELRAPDGWRWPLDGTPRLVRRFDPPPQPWLPGHRGVDLAASPGTPVLAAGGGTVVYAGVLAGRGVVSVDHPGGLRTTYEPVEPLVSAGDAVAAGGVLGLLAAGHPGCAASACLHWGLRRGAVYLDPLAVLGLARVRLLPGGTSPRTRRRAPTRLRSAPAVRPV